MCVTIGQIKILSTKISSNESNDILILRRINPNRLKDDAQGGEYWEYNK